NRLARLGIGGNEPRIDALVAVVLSDVPDDPQETTRRMEKLCRHSDRLVSAMALLWIGFLRESVGDVAGAIEVTQGSLAQTIDEEDPWPHAILHTFHAQLYAQDGDLVSATPHATTAIPVLDRLGDCD